MSSIQYGVFWTLDLHVNTLGPKLIPTRGLGFEHNLLGHSITHMFKRFSSLFLLSTPTSLHIENGTSKVAQSVGSAHFLFFFVTVVHSIVRQVASIVQRVALTNCYFLMDVLELTTIVKDMTPKWKDHSTWKVERLGGHIGTSSTRGPMFVLNHLPIRFQTLITFAYMIQIKHVLMRWNSLSNFQKECLIKSQIWQPYMHTLLLNFKVAVLALCRFVNISSRCWGGRSDW